MNGPDSLSDLVASRLRCTESSPSAGGSARLNPAQLAADDVVVGPTMLTCQMTGRWHGMPTVHACVMIMSWWHHPYPGLAHRSGRLVFGSGQLIRVKKPRGARLCAGAVTSPARDSAWRLFRRQILTRFSPMASSLPPLHSGMVKT